MVKNKTGIGFTTFDEPKVYVIPSTVAAPTDVQHLHSSGN